VLGIAKWVATALRGTLFFELKIYMKKMGCHI
jgi:hypothetical protein